MTKPKDLTRAFSADPATKRTTLLVQAQPGYESVVQQMLQGIPKETNPYDALALMTVGKDVHTVTILPPEPQQG